MQNFKRRDRETENRYFQMYEKRKRRWSVPDIANEFDCTVRTVYNALQYCQAFAINLTKAEDIQLLVDSKEDRIRRLHERIQFLEPGWEWIEHTKSQKHGVMMKTGRKFSPQAEALMYREIRELERDIVELRGMLNASESGAFDITSESRTDAQKRLLRNLDTSGESEEN